MNPLSPEERELFWKLYVRAYVTGELHRTDQKYCSYCKKILPCPPSGGFDDHWRWQVSTRDNERGRFQCKQKDKMYRGRYNKGRRNTIDGFLIRKWDIIRTRCLKPRKGYKKYYNRLKMTKEEFYKWGRESLREFRDKHELTQLYGIGIQIDRIDNTGFYEPGNLQWIFKEEHRDKTIKDRYKPVLQIDPETSRLIKEWPSIGTAAKDGYTLSDIWNCCNGFHKTHQGFVWKYK